MYPQYPSNFPEIHYHNVQQQGLRGAAQIQAFNQVQQTQKPMRIREKMTLTEKESETLQLYWKFKNYGEFNNWVQTARGKGEYDIKELPMEKPGVKRYQCRAKVSFMDYYIPSYESMKIGKSMKEAKYLSQEVIVKNIIEEGWIGIGFKELDFMEKLKQSMDPELKLKIEQEVLKIHQEKNKDIYEGGETTVLKTKDGDIILPPLPPPPPPQQMEPKIELPNEKRRIHGLSRKMQEYLKEDRFQDACQELCKIINKKQPEWNEIFSIWCYAILKKNIVYLKCILDLILQKSYTAKKREQGNKGDNDNNQQLPQQGQKEETEQDKLAKQELQRKYGSSISRMKTDNPYDVLDSYNVIVNKPDIDENAKKINSNEAECQLVQNPFEKDVALKMHLANVSQDEKKKIEDQFNNYRSELKDQGLISGEQPSKKKATEDNKEQPNMLDVTNTQQYQQQIEQYLTYLKTQKNNMDQNQFNNLLYYYTSLLEQQKNSSQSSVVNSNISTLVPDKKDDKNDKNGDSITNNNNEQEAQITEELVTPQFDFAEQQRQQQYIASNINQDLLQEKVLKNLTGNKKAYLIQQTSVPLIDTNTAREVKDPNINYLSYTLIKEMYDQLLYCGDLNFALNVAELLYTKVKLNDEEFTNAQASHYWGNKMNMIMVELLESIFQVFSKHKAKPIESLMNCNGVLSRKGNKYQQEVVMFTPTETRASLEAKILRRGQIESKDNYHQIAEGEFVMLTSLGGQQLPTEEEIAKRKHELELLQKQAKQPKNPFAVAQGLPPTPQQKSSQNIFGQNTPSANASLSASSIIRSAGEDTGPLMSYLKSINSTEKERQEQTDEQKMFFNTISDYGNKVEYALIAYVRNIDKDFNLKLFVLPTEEQLKALYQEGRSWKVTKLVNKTTHEKAMDALDVFSTKINMSHTINQILMTPPICNSDFIRRLSQSRVATEKSGYIINTNLNHSQQVALKAASTQCLTLIQGPPGTGKTTTAVEIVLEWCRQSSQRILACADSNVAVDILHGEFTKAGLRAVRVGPGYDEKNELQYDQRYRQMKALQYMGQTQQASSIRYSLLRRSLSDAQVICATNVGSMSEMMEDIQFTRVIVDEATQATEVTCLIPLIKGCQQLVLIGDHKQLPPTVLSVFAQSKGMTVSLFERLVKQGVKPNMLVEQYRMHPSISVFPSHQFYSNMLQNGVGELHRPIIKGFKWPNQYVRVAIINVQGYEQIYSASIQNNKEVEVVIEILLQMLKSGYVKINQVGIITPYDAQKRRVRNEINHQARKYPHFFGLNHSQLAKINRNSVISDVDTVDGYQGMERDVIIISTVRSNAGGNLGFLKDPRRMNVALTRAKRGLIIVGNSETLSADENWRDLVNWGKANKILINYY